MLVPRITRAAQTENDLLSCIGEYDTVAAQCHFHSTLPPTSHCKSHVNIAKINFHRQDLPHEVYIGGLSYHVPQYRPLPIAALPISLNMR